jgi:hypothetical protein
MPRSRRTASTTRPPTHSTSSRCFACGLGGTTIPFSQAELLELYPTHEDYVTKYTAAADEALESGYLLQADHDEAIAQAQAAPIPN